MKADSRVRRRNISILVAGTLVLALGIDTWIGAPVKARVWRDWAASHWRPALATYSAALNRGEEPDPAFWAPFQSLEWKTYTWEYRVLFIDGSASLADASGLPADKLGDWLIVDLHSLPSPAQASVHIIARPRSIGARIHAWLVFAWNEQYVFP